MPDPHAALVAHLSEHALRTDGPFTLRSGAVADWYMDARQTTFDGTGAQLVGEAVLDVLDDPVIAVGGLTMGADPIAIATAIAASRAGRSLTAFSIRKEAKDHGTGGRLVGPAQPGDAVCLLEDTTTTGGAFFEAHDAALESGLEVVQAICLFDRSGSIVADRMAAAGVPYRALVLPTDLGVSL
ncbi:MAG: orotate phosphoribosyltransferase [Acidimicrobiia bacterium]|nr:orotate phosphoribosyltransferase [Acidimicrobiia bacterium]